MEYKKIRAVILQLYFKIKKRFEPKHFLIKIPKRFESKRDKQIFIIKTKNLLIELTDYDRQI